MAIAIRAIPEAEWRAFRAVRLDALATDPAEYSTKLADWQGDGDTEARWRRRLGAAGSITFLATLDGAAAGIASGFPGSSPSARELISMWVAPTARGRGVGDALLDAVTRWAEGGGAETLELGVITDNARAVALYRRHGFVETGEIEDVDGVRREAKMVKPLSRAP